MQDTLHLLNQTLSDKVLIKLNFQAGGGAGASRSMVDYVDLLHRAFSPERSQLSPKSCFLVMT